MSELDPPRAPGTHRRHERNSRLGLLLSLLGVVLVGVGVLVALHLRGESTRPVVASSSSSQHVSPSPTTTPSTSASGPTASPTTTASGATITIIPPASTPAATPTPPSLTPTSSGPAPRSPLDVLNNSHITGLAKQAARTFESGGWTVSKTGNYTTTVPVTTVFYPAGELPSARRLVSEFPKIRRILPAPRGVSATHLTVVLARDWA